MYPYNKIKWKEGKREQIGVHTHKGVTERHLSFKLIKQNLVQCIKVNSMKLFLTPR